MLEKIAKDTAHFFVIQNVIKSEHEEIYAYGAEILISTVLNGVIAFFIALITNTLLPSFIFLTVFIFLRRTAGGYHAKTHLGCMTVLIFTELVFVIFINTVISELIPVYAIGAIVYSCILIFLFSPVEHPNKPLKESEKLILRKKSLFYVSAFSVLNFIMLFWISTEISIYISSGLYLSATAMAAEKLILIREKKYNEKR